MNTFSKLALVTAIAAASFAANAELKAMDDASMSAATGQAGLTIELDATVDIGEIAYQDGGFLAMSDLHIGGMAPGSRLDNIKMTVDVAGTGGGDLGVAALGQTYLAAAGANIAGSTGEVVQTVTDGDLVIALRAINPAAPVDYGFSLGSVKLAASTESGNIGNLDAGTGTVLMSNLSMGGLMGPIDIIIHEEAELMNINAYFNVLAGAVTFDFVNTSLNFTVHNTRGDDRLTVAGTSFAHAQLEIGAGTNAAGADALKFNIQDFSGDIDVTNIVIGSTPSIGNLYITDLRLNANTVIYGH